ncbi:DNA double-strand break repair nuclease NurA [Candidatus Babeliales bacterium]|nr:DNA double-strand break repair nuclease NurA [Candidatus Babeliales bacterium]
MLKHDKLAQEVSGLADKLFLLNTPQSALGQQAWKSLLKDEAFVERLKEARGASGLPFWMNELSERVAVINDLKHYSVLAVDGSQIYPDRHIAGVNCFLINCGGILLSYADSSMANFFSEPRLFLPEHIIPTTSELSFSVDLVDLKREELEFEIASQRAALARTTSEGLLTLFDGSLIFWHLESKPEEIRDMFLREYLKYLDRFYQQQLPIAGYISMPKSKELVNMIRLRACEHKKETFVFCQGKVAKCPCKQFELLVDTQLLQNFLPPFHRTTIFCSRSSITEHYPRFLKPCFFYLNVEKEIVRVEVPGWMVKDPKMIDFVCQVLIDQAVKGQGYPVALAEAHEQAVVKGADREFFFSLIRKVGIERNKQVFASQKSIKKRGIGI